jgi:predicted peptidase
MSRSDEALIGAAAVTEVFGEGEKLTGVILEYRDEIDGSQLTSNSFAVAGRTVMGAHTCTTGHPADRAAAGRFVAITLSPADADAGLREQSPARPAPDAGPEERHGPPQIGERPPAPRFRPAVASVTQVGPVSTRDGALIEPAGAPVTTSSVRDLVVEDFTQAEFHDPETGDTLRYNLFLPRGYDRGVRYPLVLFMHDAGTTSEDPLTTLRQGLGAVVWAQPESQLRHPCLVLAPQYSEVVVNDASEASSALQTTVNLVNQIVHGYGVDATRVYATGQSGGAMMTIAINIAYPELFAASLIVAGQWDPGLVAPLAAQRLWILVAEGDAKAFPGQNAITAALEAHGARVARATWDGDAGAAELDRAAAMLCNTDTQVKYAVLRRGTVVPEDQTDDPLNNHIHTWRIAYSIGQIRDWLFQQQQR